MINLILSACSVVGVRALEEPIYQTQMQEGNFEIREYASYLVAEVFMEGEDFDEASGDGFRILADYIFGNNLSHSASVQMAGKAEAASENIAMTAPVQMDQGEQPDQWRMAFSLPSKWNLETAPVPNDQRVNLREILPERMVVLQFSGRMGVRDLEEKEQELRQWATKQGITVVGSVRTARYDPPWTLPFLRKNEVQLKVED
ncbi:MAG: heme-binding protein [Deltaproteobacteria bacterium]|nr:heme-binding protein [Deltaproteobacteria bacterium]MBT7202592.1 heme-binding protein [Deltaproteobacteria bacterium]